MKTYKEFMAENRAGMIGTALVFANRLSNLETRIKNEKDPAKQNILIAKQNKLLGYMNGLSFSMLQKKGSGGLLSRIRRRR